MEKLQLLCDDEGDDVVLQAFLEEDLAVFLSLLSSVIALSKTKGIFAALSFMGKYNSGMGQEAKTFTNGFITTAITGGMANSHAPSTYLLLSKKTVCLTDAL